MQQKTRLVNKWACTRPGHGHTDQLAGARVGISAGCALGLGGSPACHAFIAAVLRLVVRGHNTSVAAPQALPRRLRTSLIVALRMLHLDILRNAITPRPAQHEDTNERRDKWANCFGSSCTRHTPATTKRNSHAGRPCRTA